MNKKQWFTLGIGLIVMGIFFGALSGIIDCNALIEERIGIIEDAMDANLGSEVLYGSLASMDAWAISCLDTNMYMTWISSISWTLGILFIICGFLEKNIGDAK